MTERPTLSPPEDEIDLAALAERTWRFRWMVAATTCVAPIVAFLVIWMQPPLYETTATVLIEPSRVMPAVQSARPLALGPLSKDGYRQEAESEPVMNLLRHKIQLAGIPGSAIDRPGALTATAYSAVPWLGLTARAPDPVHAQTIANAWVEALREVDMISSAGRRQKGMDEIINGHAKAVSRVVKAETELHAAQDRHLQANASSEVSVSEAQKSSELMMRLQRALTIEDHIGEVNATLADTRERILELEREFKGAPALSALAEQLARERSVLRGAHAREVALQAQLREAKHQVERLRREVSSAKLALARLSTQQAREIDSLTRAATDARADVRKLEEQLPEAVTAKADPMSYLTKGTSAPLPDAHRPRNYARALLAAPLGLFAALLFAALTAVVLESRKRLTYR